MYSKKIPCQEPRKDKTDCMELETFFTKYLPLSPEIPMEVLEAVAEVRRFRAGEYLIKQGERPRYLFFLMQGVVRGMLLDINGKDITDCIVFHCGEPVMPDNDFSCPASVALQALETCDMVLVPLEDVQDLMHRYPALCKVYQRFLLQAANFHRVLKIVTYQYTAAQRYQWFLDNFPGLIDRIPHKYVASFLNMTPVTLSKVRKAIKVSDPLPE